MTVWLKENLLSIEDVVVVGFGVQRKETVTGAINSIGSKEILRSPTANVTNALAGKMAGLTAVQRGGEPGKDGATFKIRGIGTLNEGSESAPLILIDGIERTSLDVIDPNEIETINILKDASATAVYGVRGANGVILVTTKTGQPGRAQVTLTSNFGWQSYTMMPELVNAYEWATLYNEGLAHENSTKAPFPQEALDAWKNHTNPVLYPDVDWVDKLLRKSAPQQQYNVNVSGGSDRTKYFVSFGMLHQEGIYKEYDIDGVDFSVNPDYRRFNLRANLDIDVMKGMTLGLRLGTIFTDGNYPNASTSNIFDYLLRTVPGGGPGLINGKLVTGYSGDDPLENYERRVSNPIFDILEQGYQEYNTSTYNLSADLNYDLGFLVKGLSVRGKVAYDDYGTHRVAYTTGSIPQYTVVVDNDYEDGYRLVKASDETAFGAKESYSTRYRNVYLEGGISYAGQFGRHSVTALALYNQRVQDNPSFQYDLPKGLLGFVGRITYNFDNRYLAEFNAGYNGSENFAEGQTVRLLPRILPGLDSDRREIHTPQQISDLRQNPRVIRRSRKRPNRRRPLSLPASDIRIRFERLQLRNIRAEFAVLSRLRRGKRRQLRRDLGKGQESQYRTRPENVRQPVEFHGRLFLGKTRQHPLGLRNRPLDRGYDSFGREPGPGGQQRFRTRTGLEFQSPELRVLDFRRILLCQK